jgi:hypothetical protein
MISSSVKSGRASSPAPSWQAPRGWAHALYADPFPGIGKLSRIARVVGPASDAGGRSEMIARVCAAQVARQICRALHLPPEQAASEKTKARARTSAKILFICFKWINLPFTS